jgi:flagellar biosynthesis protein FlhG
VIEFTNFADTQAGKLQELMSSNNKPKNPNTKFIAFTSGKGGVGKSTISANTAYVLSTMGYKTALFDADIGLANLDVLLGVKTNKNILHVIKREASLKDIIVHVDANLMLIPGDSGNEIFQFGSNAVFDEFCEESKLLDDLDFMIVDTGAGIGANVLNFVQASDMAIVVTTSDPTAIVDAFAMIKTIGETRNVVYVVLNMVQNLKEAEKIFAKIQTVAKKSNPKLELEMIGALEKNSDVQKSVKQRFLFSKNYPLISCTGEIENIVSAICAKMERKMLNTEKASSLSSFFKKLMRQL